MSKLYLIPTPIGNLKDITFRAVEMLKQVDFVYAEDTRTSRRLFQEYDITTNLRSHHMHNEHKTADLIADQILAGDEVALISDAGTPAISDPGYLLVQSCIEKGVEIECFPGATAFVPALVISGMTSDRFVFEGFLPHKKGRMKRLESLKDEEKTIIFYESPYRVKKALEQMKEVFGPERKVAVIREISKLHETVNRGNIEALLEEIEEGTLKEKGEFVMVVEGKAK